MDSLFIGGSDTSLETNHSHFTESYQDVSAFPKDLTGSQYEKCEGNHSNVFYLRSNPNSMAFKVFKNDFFSQDSLHLFFHQIIEMAKCQHPSLVELKKWCFSRPIKADGKAGFENQPIILTERYIKFDHHFQMDQTQSLLFIYGYCRGFKFLNSFGHTTDSVHPGHIYLCSPTQNNKLKPLCRVPSNQYSYPIISFFCTEEALKEPASKAEQVQNITNHITSYCQFLESLPPPTDSQNEEETPYSLFLKSAKNIKDFNHAVLILENKVFPKLLKENKLKEKVFERYKRFLDYFEADCFNNLNDSDHVSQVLSIFMENEGHPYRIERQLLDLANRGHLEACLRMAIDHSTGYIVPKDLVLSIRYLWMLAQNGYHPMADMLIKNLLAIRDRRVSTQPKYEVTREGSDFDEEGFEDPLPESQPDLKGLLVKSNPDDLNHLDEFDEVTLYYKGAFFEALAIPFQIAEDDTIPEGEIKRIRLYQNNAVKCYMESLKKKPAAKVMARLGGILVRDIKENKREEGFKLLEKAAKMGDLYGTIAYGTNLLNDLRNHTYAERIKNELLNKIIDLFTTLEEKKYWNASSILGDIYSKMHEDKMNSRRSHHDRHRNVDYHAEAIAHYEKAIEDFADESARMKLDNLF